MTRRCCIVGQEEEARNVAFEVGAMPTRTNPELLLIVVRSLISDRIHNHVTDTITIQLLVMTSFLILTYT